MADQDRRQSLDVRQARNLANTTKTPPIMGSVTPRWFMQLLPWVNVEAGTYRVNHRKTIIKRTKIQIAVDDGVASVTGAQLKQLDLFSSCSAKFLEELAGNFKSEKFKKGTSIFKKGDKGDKFYILADGQVSIWHENEYGQRVQYATLSVGDYLGEIALLRGGDRMANVDSLTPCVFVSLDRTAFEQMLKKNEDVRKRIEQVVAEREQQNKDTNEYGEKRTSVITAPDGEQLIAGEYVEYEESPREYAMFSMQSIVKVHTRISDLYNSPHNQLQQQLRLTVSSMKEQQEWELINNSDFGLLNNIAPNMTIQTRKGPPTPDDLDELVAMVWKEPAFFLAHPRAIAAFGRECTRRGVPPPTSTIGGSPILTWRGIPLIPCDKLMVNGKLRPGAMSGKTNILLVRVGENKQGVVGLHQAGIHGEHMPSLTVRPMGINPNAVADYLVTLYFSLAVLTEDAVACLSNVEIGNYHEYQ